MLQNIYILTGHLPAKTGDLKEDYENLRAFQERLLRGLETNFDQIDSALEKLQKGGKL